MKEIIITLFISLVIFMTMIYSHELAHVNAYEYKGYHNNTIQFTSDHMGGLSVQNHDTINQWDKSDIYQANMVVDAVGYNISVPALFIIMVLLLIYLGDKGK